MFTNLTTVVLDSISDEDHADAAGAGTTYDLPLIVLSFLKKHVARHLMALHIFRPHLQAFFLPFFPKPDPDK